MDESDFFIKNAFSFASTFSSIERKCVGEKKIFAILPSFDFNCYTENVCVFIQ